MERLNEENFQLCDLVYCSGKNHLQLNQLFYDIKYPEFFGKNSLDFI